MAKARRASYIRPASLSLPHSDALHRSRRGGKTIDEYIRALVKDVLGLPDNASTHYLYSLKAGGGIGLPQFSREVHFAFLEGAFKLLTSPDKTIRSLASEQLRRTAASRLQVADPSPDEIADYLSGNAQVEHRGRGNVWTRTRMASYAVKVAWALELDDGALSPSLIVRQKRERKGPVEQAAEERAANAARRERRHSLERMAAPEGPGPRGARPGARRRQI